MNRTSRKGFSRSLGSREKDPQQILFLPFGRLAIERNRREGEEEVQG
jgi:hypothetical protein